MKLDRSSVLITICTALIAAANGRAQGPRFRADTSAIVVDVIVRDKSGRPVVDLQREDFEILEDGVKQDIIVFEPPSGTFGTSRTESSSSTRGSEQTDPRPRQTQSYAALVFGRLSAQGRLAAVKASDAFLRDRNAELDRVGVFSVDRALVTLSDFTDDEATLSRAIQRATTRATGAPPPPSGADGTASAEYHGPMLVGVPSNQQQSDMAGFALEPDYEARASLLALAQLVGALGDISGRKTIIYFAEALTVSPDVEPYFQGLVERANRNNVSIYPVDAAGLRVHSADREFAGALNSSTLTATGETVGPDVSYLNALSAMLRSGNVPAIMANLALATGGASVTGTNDLVNGVTRINEDRRVYDLLSYVPAKISFNGEYRKILVRTRRPNVSVYARPGYIAEREAKTPTAFPFEVPAMRALEGDGASSELPLAIRAYQFPLPDGRSFVPIVARVPVERLTVSRSANGEQKDVAIVARVLDSTGTVVKRGSQPYRIVRKSHVTEPPTVTFFRQPVVPPGEYSVEAAVVDLAANRTGVGRSRVSVPSDLGERFRVSSVVLITEGRPGCGTTADPVLQALCMEGLILVPSAGEPVSRSRTGKATYYFTVVGPDASLVSAKLDLLQGNNVVGATTLALRRPDAEGTLRHAGTLPIAQLREGEYTLRVVVALGGVSAVRETAFTVVP